MIFNGNDIVARDKTGSGKTLAYSIPIIEKLRKDSHFINKKRGRAALLMVIVPTRELCL